MAYNGVQIENSPNIIVITDSDANQITVTQPITRTVEVTALGPQGPVGPQGPTGSMAQSNSGSFSITGSLTVSGSSTFTNIGPAIFSGSVSISGSALYNGKEILTTAISGGFVTTSSFNSFTSSINSFTASYNTGSFTGSFSGVGSFSNFTASNAFVTGNVTVLGTASINTLIVNQTQLSTGSNQLGDAADDTQTLYGTVRIPTGSFTVSGSSYFSGSVGIGTSAPLEALDITGNLNITGFIYRTGLAGKRSFLYTSGNNEVLNLYDNSGVTKVDLRTNGTSYFTGGNVGIGTTTPSALLHISGTSASNLLQIDSPASSNILFVTGSGRVGIGTTTPSGSLDVRGNILIGGAADNRLYLGAVILQTFSFGTVWNGVSDSMFLEYSALGTGKFVTFQGNGGKVGIGTTTPTGRLHVKGNGTTSATTALLIENSNTSASLAVLDNGNVGIGTANPGYKLDVNGNSKFAATFSSYAADGLFSATALPGIFVGTPSPARGTFIGYRDFGGGEYWGRIGVSGSVAWSLGIGNSAGTNFSIGLNNNTGTDYFTIVSGSGNIGIGTTNPSYKLQVNGSVYFNGSTNDFYVDGVSRFGGTNSYNTVINSSGSIGIGITSPSVKLDISGSIRSEIASDGNFITLQATSQRVHFIKRAGQILQFTSDAATTYDVRFDSSNSSVYILTGSVGIGTANPLSKLQVAGDIRIQNETGLITDYGPLIGRYNTSQVYVGTGGSYSIVKIARTDDGGLNVLSSGNTGMGTSSPSAKLHISGASTANLLRVDSDVSSSILFVTGSGRVGIGTANPTASLHIVDAGTGAVNSLQVNTLFRVTGDGQTRWGQNVSQGIITWDTNRVMIGGLGSNNLDLFTSGVTRARLDTSGNFGIGTSTGTISARTHIIGAGATSATTAFLIQNSTPTTLLTIRDDGNASFNGNTQITGSLAISASAGTGSAFSVYKSGSTVMSIQGSQGELFSITDSLSGSLFSVSNISGLPILEVFSDNTVLLGSYLDPMLITTQRVTANSGSTVIYSLPTSLYDGIFVDYTIRSGSNARAGQLMGMWSGSTANFTDNSTTDFGSTSGFIFGLIISGSNMVLTGSASTSGWTVRAGIRSI